MASEKDIQDVINTLIAEGVGEGQEGMRRIAETILNRAEQRGLSPAQVVRQPAQYTGYSSPGPAARRAQSDPSAISAAQAAWELAQGPDDPTNGANHYYAPGTISQPYWARSMTPTGTYGGHSFFSDRPGASGVGTQLSVNRTPPTPQTAGPLMASLRNNTSPSGGNGALQSALDAYALRERNRVTPASADERVTARNRVPPIDAREAARRAALSIGGNQTYAGMDGAPYSAASSRGVPMTGADAARRAALSIGANQSFAGMDGGRVIPNRLTPSPAGLPARYGTMTPAQVGAIGVPAIAPAQPARRLPVVGSGRVAPVPMMRPASLGGRVAPTPFMRPAGLGGLGAPVPVSRPLMAASRPAPVAVRAPMMAAAPAPTTIYVRGSNTVQPAPQPQSLYYSNPVEFGNRAVSQSGDTSVGNQREAAQARSQGSSSRRR